MSGSEDDGGVGRREVAYRLFAAEFDDADFSYSESDEDRAPNYVVTPTGARVNRLFAVGVLTEIEQVNDEVLRARIVDPTGAFVVYAGQYQPDALAFLEAASPPLFIAVTGKARTFEPEDGDRVYTSIRPETISEVDAETRDRWAVQAAEQTIERVARMASAKQTGLAGNDLYEALTEQGVQEGHAEGIMLALDHYGTTGDYLDAIRSLALDATRVVAGELDETASLTISPSSGGDDPIPVLAETEFEAAAATPETSTAESDDAVTTADPTEAADDRAVTGTASETTATTDSSADQSAATESAPTTPEEPPTTDETSSTEDASATAASASSATGESTATDAVSETPSAAETTATDSSSTADDDDLGDFEPEFELDEDERDQIEEEYGTDFQSGTDVDEPGEAGIETPDPEAVDPAAEEQGAPAAAADAEPAPESAGAPAGSESVEPDTDAATSDAVTETPSTAIDAGADEIAGDADDDGEAATEGQSAEPAEDVDLEDAVMDAMEELDDGSGADREEVLASVVDQYGADPDAVEDAVQDALMGGRCYEPEDGKLMPI